MKLAADPLCELQTHCGAGLGPGLMAAAATEVDHTIPIRERPDLRLDPANHKSTCHSCHSAKTAKENGFGGPGLGSSSYFSLYPPGSLFAYEIASDARFQNGTRSRLHNMKGAE